MGTQIVFSDDAVNTGLAAAASEALVSTAQQIALFAPFNFLDVTNRDAVDMELRLDGLNQPGKVFQIPAGGSFGFDPEDGYLFSGVTITNLDAATAMTAGKILVNWAKKVTT